MLMNLDDLYTAYLSVNACDQEIINIEKKYRHIEFPREIEEVLCDYLGDYAEFYFKAGFRQAVKLLENE